jgi:hypothetical protein
MMTRRALATVAVAGATMTIMPSLARAESLPQAKNIVMVHGLFADGSC